MPGPGSLCIVLLIIGLCLTSKSSRVVLYISLDHSLSVLLLLFLSVFHSCLSARPFSCWYVFFCSSVHLSICMSARSSVHMSLRSHVVPSSLYM
uniref:Secreted protein n=1 Tax=Rhipicephalus microplus TaxID=6941 RepID=A0A6M2DAX3_RHIMP